MAWIDRGGRRYYRRSVRHGDKVRTEYIGAGPLAEGWAEIDAASRELRQHRRMMARADLTNLRQDLAEEERDLDELVSQVRDLARAALEAAGYHRHCRGPWRKRRTMTDAKATMTPAGETPGTSVDSIDDALGKLILRARAGDETALPTLRNVLDGFAKVARPEGMDVMIRMLGGDATHAAESALIGRVAGKDLAATEATQRWLAKVRSELAGPEPTVLERLLADRVALCYADASHADSRADQASARGAEPGHLEALDRRRSRANRRFLESAKALAAVRKLALPALQVNIAEHQINVAGAGTEDA